MMTSTQSDQAPTDICWCCGSRFAEAELVRLGEHPEVAICLGCARFLHRRAQERFDENSTGLPVRIRRIVGAARGAIVARGWHDRRFIGRLLRRIDRYL